MLSVILLAGIAATAAIQSGSVVRGFGFAAGLVVATAVLAGSAWLVVRADREGPSRFGFGDLAARSRSPGAPRLGHPRRHRRPRPRGLDRSRDVADPGPTLGATQGRSAGSGADGFSRRYPARPVGRCSRGVGRAGAEHIDSVEVVMGRLASINGVPVAELAVDASDRSSDRRWVLTREQRLTSMVELARRTTSSWMAHCGRTPTERRSPSKRTSLATWGSVSATALSSTFRALLVELLVSSIRTVEWESFSINFFLVVEPGCPRSCAAIPNRDRSARCRCGAAAPERSRRAVSQRHRCCGCARFSKRWSGSSNSSATASAFSVPSACSPGSRSSPVR